MSWNKPFIIIIQSTINKYYKRRCIWFNQILRFLIVFIHWIDNDNILIVNENLLRFSTFLGMFVDDRRASPRKKRQEFFQGWRAARCMQLAYGWFEAGEKDKRDIKMDHKSLRGPGDAYGKVCLDVVV